MNLVGVIRKVYGKSWRPSDSVRDPRIDIVKMVIRAALTAPGRLATPNQSSTQTRRSRKSLSQATCMDSVMQFLSLIMNRTLIMSRTLKSLGSAGPCPAKTVQRLTQTPKSHCGILCQLLSPTRQQIEWNVNKFPSYRRPSTGAGSARAALCCEERNKTANEHPTRGIKAKDDSMRSR